MQSSSGSGCVKLEQVRFSRHQVFCLFTFEDETFTTNYWYPDVDLNHLRERLTAFEFERILFHIAAFEINKICSFMPQSLDLSKFEKFVDPAFKKIWLTIFENVWAQWRYENALEIYRAPRIVAEGPANDLPPISTPLVERFLNFCGGGKDSLVSSGILGSLAVDFDNLFYSSSIYGTHARQHDLSKVILESGSAKAVYRQWIFEDYFEAPFHVEGPGGRPLTRTAAETPSSIFSAVPIALFSGAKYLVLGHERSADTGQVRWEQTGEDINHQWGKSYAAEQLINSYLMSHLVSGLTYFSILKPIYDTLIFYMLNKSIDRVPFTQSCNVDKPWCGKCPKCAYVYLGYAAMLPESVVRETFPRNFLDDPDNYSLYRELAGLTGKLPFECIGQADETKLMLNVAEARGCGGDGLSRLVNEIGPVPLDQLISKYTTVHDPAGSFPASVRSPYVEMLLARAAEARQFLQTHLQTSPKRPPCAATPHR